LLLWAGIASPLRWWVKAGAIVVTSVFFVEAFYSSKSLLGCRASDGCRAIPAAVDARGRAGSEGARCRLDLLWVEEVDENNVPVGTPAPIGCPTPSRWRTNRSRRATRSCPVIPQEGTAEDIDESQDAADQHGEPAGKRQPAGPQCEQCRSLQASQPSRTT